MKASVLNARLSLRRAARHNMTLARTRTGIFCATISVEELAIS